MKDKSSKKIRKPLRSGFLKMMMTLVIIVTTVATSDVYGCIVPQPTITGLSSVCVGSTGVVYSTDGGMQDYIWVVSPGGTITAGGGTADTSVTISWNTAWRSNCKCDLFKSDRVYFHPNSLSCNC